MICKLKDISINNRGYYGIGASAVNYDRNKYTYLRITDINDNGSLNKTSLMSVDDRNANNYILQKNDIVFARTGASTGRNYFYDGEIKNLVYAGFLIKFSLNDKLVNPRFIKYYCLSKKYNDWILSTITGSTRSNINEKQLSNMPIYLPDREIQNKVVKIMDALSIKIKLNTDINDNLFNLININYKKYLNEVSKSDKTEEISVKDIFDFESGVEPGSRNYLEKEDKDTIKFYRVGDMDSDCKTYIKKDLSNNKFINEDDIAVSFDATIGRIGYGLNGSFSTGMKKINVNNKYKNIIDNSVVFAYFNNTDTQNKISENAKGTTILHAGSAINFLNFKYNEELLIKYGKIISIFFQKMKQIKKENENLSNLRDTLLPKLMNGEIDLENIEI